MAIISNFELLFKAIAPVVGPASEVGRIVVQGYFLEISNLEKRDITLILRTRTPVRDPLDSVDTEFTTSNNVVAYDITKDNVFDTVMINAGEQIVGKQLGHYVSCLFLPAGQTASVAILPNAMNLFASPTADLAIRGYTELILSSNLDSIFPLTFSPPESARILVSAEHRGTFIDPQFDPSSSFVQTDLDFDQLAYSLLTANGKAFQLINTHAPFNDPFQDLLTSNALNIGEMEGISQLSLTSQNTIIDASQSTRKEQLSLSTLNKSLSPDANCSERNLTFKFSGIPVSIKYSIKDGKYVVNEKSVAQAINQLRRKKRLTKEELDPSLLAKKINKALTGNKRAESYINKVLNKLVN